MSPLPSDDPMFDYQSPTYVSEDYSDSSDSDESHDIEIPPPTEKPDVTREILLTLNLTGQQIFSTLMKYCTIIQYRFKVFTNDQFKKIKETFSKAKTEFLEPPSVNEVIMASKSVRNNTGLPVINLRPLNRFVPNKKFRMESILLLKDILKPNSFLTKID